MPVSSDTADFLFRFLFCLIFIGLGGEHLFSDNLIQLLMPQWVPAKQLVSVLSGLWLIGCGSLILIGWHLRLAALGLGAFLILVTLAVHLPYLFYYPSSIPESAYWIWDILQRSNLVKNLCLLGVCFHLLHHQPGKYSIREFLHRRKTKGTSTR